MRALDGDSRSLRVGGFAMGWEGYDEDWFWLSFLRGERDRRDDELSRSRSRGERIVSEDGGGGGTPCLVKAFCKEEI